MKIMHKWLLRYKYKLLAYTMLIGIACGPGPLDFMAYYSLFYADNASIPDKANYLVYSRSNEDLYFFDKNDLADSLNLNEWQKYIGSSISREVLRSQLYNAVSGDTLANLLTKIGKSEAAAYVLLAQEIDDQTDIQREYWEPEIPFDPTKLEIFRNELMNLLANTKDTFLQERYLFQLLKIDAKLEINSTLLADYKTYQKNDKSLIGQWNKSRYAGALLHTGDTTKAIQEFSQIFAHAPTRKYQAYLSLYRVPNSAFEKAAAAAKNTPDEINIWALQSMYDHTDGLPLLEKIAKKEPNHELLELAMANEIRKNELYFYADENVSNYYQDLDVYDENYEIDSLKVHQFMEQAGKYFEKLLGFNLFMLEQKELKNKNFWHLSAAYLHITQKQFDKAKEELAAMNSQQTANESQKKQAVFLETLIAIREKAEEEEVLVLMDNIPPASDFISDNMRITLSNSLADYYQTAEPPKGGLFSCQNNSKDDLKPVKVFLAKTIQTTESLPYYFDNRYQDLIAATSTNDLQKVIDFLQESSHQTNEQKLIEIAKPNLSDLKLDLARKYTRNHEYLAASQLLQEIQNTESMTLVKNDFGTKPAKFIGDDDILKIKNPVAYLSYLADLQTGPKTAENIYKLGLGAYNLSYYGAGWMLSKDYRSTVEIPYGEITNEDYYTNMYTKELMEKALAKKPNQELGAKICYLGAMAERNQYYLAYVKGEPTYGTYEEMQQYERKMEQSVKPTFWSFFNRLKNKYHSTAYEQQVINECISYKNFVNRYAE